MLPTLANQAIVHGPSSLGTGSFSTMAAHPAPSPGTPAFPSTPTSRGTWFSLDGLSLPAESITVQTPRAESIPDMNSSMLADGNDGTEQPCSSTTTLNAAAVDAVMGQGGWPVAFAAMGAEASSVSDEAGTVTPEQAAAIKAIVGNDFLSISLSKAELLCQQKGATKGASSQAGFRNVTAALAVYWTQETGPRL